MSRASHFERWPETARFAVLVFLLLACCLWGGGSRFDIPGLMLLQPVAVLCIAAFILIPGPFRFDAVRAPLLMLAALAGIMAVQLVPLPPDWWMALPGHAPFAATDGLAGAEAVWRPISLTPDWTLGSLIGLVVPAAVLVGFASLPAERTYALLPYLLGAAALSAFLGLVQMGSGVLYFYEVTNVGAAVGLFSNRNHQAVFLVLMFPMLALWVTQAAHQHRYGSLRLWISGAMVVFLLPSIAITGSRAGILLALLGLALGWLLLHLHGGMPSLGRNRRFSFLLGALPIVGGIVVVGVAAFLSKAEALDRLLAMNVADDRRAEAMPMLFRIAGDFAPFGSGFGSFDPVFRFYETYPLLRSTYFNHAHNDLVELAITGGIPALLVLLAFLIWAVPRMFRAFRERSSSRTVRFAFFGVAVVLIVLLSSIVDYPLRTPLLAAVFSLACAWLGNERTVRSQASEEG